MVFDSSATFLYDPSGKTQFWVKPKHTRSVYFFAYGGGGAGSSTEKGGGGAYVFSNYNNLDPDISYNIYINVGGGGTVNNGNNNTASPIINGGISPGGITDNAGSNFSNGGNGTTIEGLNGGGGGGMTSIFYSTPFINEVRLIAGGGGGAGSKQNAYGGNSGKIGEYGGGIGTNIIGGGEGGNNNLIGDGGLGAINEGVNGYNFIFNPDQTSWDVSNSALPGSGYNNFFTGGGGGSGGTFAGGAGGAGYGGGAGGNKGGGGGGGSYSLAPITSFISGGGGAGGNLGQDGGNGRVEILWNESVNTIPANVSMLYLNAQHTNRSSYIAPYNFPVTIQSILITANTKNTNSLIISRDNEMYTVSNDGLLHAFNHNFTLRWSFSPPSFGYKFIGTPIISNDETIYLVAHVDNNTSNLSNYLYAIIDNKTQANEKWKLAIDNKTSVSCVFDASGVVYVGTNSGTIYAIKDFITHGNSIWTYRIDPELNGNPYLITGAPTFNISNTNLCFGYSNSTYTSSSIRAIDISNLHVSTGKPQLLWNKTVTDKGYFNTPSIDDNGIIYAATSHGYIYAYDISNNGANKWTTTPLTINDVSLSTISIGSDDHIYVTSSEGLNVVDSSNGELLWKYFIDLSGLSVNDGNYNSSPTIDANNNIYFGGRDSYLYSIDGVNRQINWRYKAGGAIQSTPVINSNQHIYFTDNIGFVYDLCGNSVNPATTTPIVPMHMINQSHNGISSYKSPISEPDISWSLPFISSNLYVLPSIAIDSSGTMYIGSNDGFLYAINSLTGIEQWRLSLVTAGVTLQTSPDSLYTSCLLSPDGTIFVGSKEGYLYAVNPNGTLKWSYYTGGPLQSSPIMDSSGSIYFGAGFNVYSIGDAGYKGYSKWLFPYETTANVYSSPALGSNGNLYVGSDDGNVYAINSFTGKEEWVYDDLSVNPIYSSPTIDGSDNIIVCNGSSMNGVLFYLNKDNGNKLWDLSFNPINVGPFYNTCAVMDDVIYLSTVSYLYAVNRINGNVIWKYQKGQFYHTSPIIDASKNIIFGSINVRTNKATLNSIKDNSDNYSENWNHIVSDTGRLSTPSIGNDGTIYVSSTDNVVYALV